MEIQKQQFNQKFCCHKRSVYLLTPPPPLPLVKCRGCLRCAQIWLFNSHIPANKLTLNVPLHHTNRYFHSLHQLSYQLNFNRVKRKHILKKITCCLDVVYVCLQQTSFESTYLALMLLMTINLFMYRINFLFETKEHLIGGK